MEEQSKSKRQFTNSRTNSATDSVSLDDLRRKAIKVRSNIINQIFWAQSGHPGSSLSCVEILVTLYATMTPADVFILSKGHAAPAWYATLCEFEFIEESMLREFRAIYSVLQGHPSPNLVYTVTPTGSLGQGAAVSCGVAIGKQKENILGKVYVLLGDGELSEGVVWEAVMFAAHYKLNNLIFIIDSNGLASDDKTWHNYEDIYTKFNTFGWESVVIDGHNFLDIKNALDQNKSRLLPYCVVARTTKGKGVSFMENRPEWHGSVALTKEQYEQALRDIK